MYNNAIRSRLIEDGTGDEYLYFSQGHKHSRQAAYMTESMAQEVLKAAFDLYGPRDMEPVEPSIQSGVIYVEVERAWEVSATIEVRFTPGWDEFEPGHIVQGYTVSASVSWTSPRNITAARAALALYGDMLTLAETITAMFEDVKIFHKELNREADTK